MQSYKMELQPEAVSSVAFGIVSVLADIVIIASRAMYPHGYPMNGYDIDSNIVLTSVNWGWLLGTMGIILGLLALRSPDKKLAISGIVLSVVSMLINLPTAITNDIFVYIFPFELFH